MKDLLLELARANRFINRTWLEIMSEVPFATLDENRGAFFESIFGTLNHILLGDRIWLGRLREEPYAFESLRQRLCADLESFKAEREATDAQLIAYVEQVSDFSRPLEYRSAQGDPFRQPLYEAIHHLFAHQHHHRGQVSQMCHELKIPIPDGGLLGYFRQRG